MNSVNNYLIFCIDNIISNMVLYLSPSETDNTHKWIFIHL